jgi:hypothetical protein
MKLLKPTKHSHPDRTLIAVSLILVKRLKNKRIEKFDNLKEFLKEKAPDCDVLFLPALHFLYILGLIEYSTKTDAFEFLRKR